MLGSLSADISEEKFTKTMNADVPERTRNVNRYIDPWLLKRASTSNETDPAPPHKLQSYSGPAWHLHPLKTTPVLPAPIPPFSYYLTGYVFPQPLVLLLPSASLLFCSFSNSSYKPLLSISSTKFTGLTCSRSSRMTPHLGQFQESSNPKQCRYYL